MLIIFVAGLFRGESHWDVRQNVNRARAAGLEVAKMGCYPFIPHSNTCYFFGTLPEAHWLEGCQEMIRRSDALLAIEGWQNSSGTRDEIELARELGKPVFLSLKELWCWLAARAEKLGLEAPNELRAGDVLCPA